MTITTTLTNLKNSSTALNVTSCIVMVAAAFAAKYDKPVLATGLVGLSTAVSAREVYVRHNRGAVAIQSILLKSTEVSELNVPAHIVAAMKASEA